MKRRGFLRGLLAPAAMLAPQSRATQLVTAPAASAVNNIRITSLGNDANIRLTLYPKGAGAVNFQRQ